MANVCHMCHVWQLTCTLLLYGGGEPSRVAHMCHVWQLTCTLLLYGGGAVNVQQSSLTCGPHARLTCSIHCEGIEINVWLPCTVNVQQS